VIIFDDDSPRLGGHVSSSLFVLLDPVLVVTQCAYTLQQYGLAIQLITRWR